MLLRAQTSGVLEGLPFGAAASLISGPQPIAFPLVSAHWLPLPFWGGRSAPGAVD